MRVLASKWGVLKFKFVRLEYNPKLKTKIVSSDVRLYKLYSNLEFDNIVLSNKWYKTVPTLYTNTLYDFS